MAEEAKPSKVEIIKENSRQLRGTIPEELQNDSPQFSGDAIQLLKHHGTYQQDDRDARKAKNPDGTPVGKQYSMMLRSRVPGGRLTPDQMLVHLDLCEQYGNGTLRITDRQAFQIHGILKGDLKPTIKAINDSLMTTIAACGDVERNIMCCPAPFRGNSVRDEMQAMAYALAEHLKPQTTAYYELWLTDENGEKTNAAEFEPVEEPIYGKLYLPRKFKTGVALPEDNCIDIHSQDLGFLVIVENDAIVGYNVLVGGGMGQTPSNDKTFPAISQAMTFVTPDQVLAIAEAVVKVQRDFGNRSDRKRARMKYLIHDWGLAKFKAKVEEYFGGSLPEPKPVHVTDALDHIGWFEQGDGKWFIGVNVENGRLKDEGDLHLKAAIREILSTFQTPMALTALQGMIFYDVAEQDKAAIDAILAKHGVKPVEELKPVRRYAISCPALPTCGLAVTESERVFPGLIDQFEAELANCGIPDERLAIHMTGCPNGCARPYAPDIGLVGKTLGKYTVYLGGNLTCSRLGFIFKDLVPLDDVVPTVAPVLRYYSTDRENGESFGDFCARKGLEDLAGRAETST